MAVCKLDFDNVDFDNGDLITFGDKPVVPAAEAAKSGELGGLYDFSADYDGAFIESETNSNEWGQFGLWLYLYEPSIDRSAYHSIRGIHDINGADEDEKFEIDWRGDEYIDVFVDESGYSNEYTTKPTGEWHYFWFKQADDNDLEWSIDGDDQGIGGWGMTYTRMEAFQMYTRMDTNSGFVAYVDDIFTGVSRERPPMDLSASWNDANGSYDLSWTLSPDDSQLNGYRILRATTPGGRTTSNYTTIDTVNIGVSTYQDTTATFGETYYYIVTGYDASYDGSLTIPTNEFVAVPPPGTVENVDATYVADDHIDLSYSPDPTGGAPDDYDIQIQRNGGPWATPAAGSGPSNTSSTAVSYGPDSDALYGSVVGIDSSFRFRVRGNNDAGTGDWGYSDTVYTTPVPPSDVSVSRPDANTVDIHFTQASHTPDYTRVGIREDTGSGYSAWTLLQNVAGTSYYGGPDDIQQGDTATTGSSVILRFNVGSSYQSHTLKEDARYQFRLRNQQRGNSSGDVWSEWVYADYGNEGNVFFTDGFESGDLSAWDTTNLTDANSGVRTSLNADLGETSAAEGSYALQLVNNDYAEKNLGDLSGESDVLVILKMSSGSLELSSEYNLVRWYDGSTWQDLVTHGWEYNKQGWVEVRALVPDSYLSTDNRLRVQSHGGGPVDFAAFDDVVVSDVLHEYTQPAAPSGLSLDTSTDREITATWVNNSSFDSETVAGRTGWRESFEDGMGDFVGGFVTTNTKAQDGTQSVYSPASSTDTITRDITVPPGVMEMSHWAYIDGSVSTKNHHISAFYEYGAAWAGPHVSVRSPGNIEWNDGAWNDSGHTFPVGTWVNVLTVIDVDNQTFSLSIDDGSGEKNVILGGEFIDRSTFTVGDAREIRLSGNADTDVYYDNFVWYEEDAILESDSETHPYTGLLDGERYYNTIRQTIHQPRRGIRANTIYSPAINSNAVTNLPAPTDLSSPAHDFDTISLAWAANHNYGDTLVQFRRTGDSAWTTFATVPIGTEAETITGLLNGELYDVRIVAHTDHDTTEDE